MKNYFKKLHPVNVILGVVFAVLFVLTFALYREKWNDTLFQLVLMGLFLVSASNFIPKKAQKSKPKAEKTKNSPLSIAVTAVTLIAVVATVVASHYVLNLIGADTQLYRFAVIAFGLVISGEIFVPFILSFELKKPSVRELVIIAVMCALAVAGRAVFYAVPQFKPITAIVIIAGACMGMEKGFLTGAVSGFVSNIIFGQGSWTPWQMLAWGAVGLAAGIVFCFVKKGKFQMAVFGGIATLLVYGGIVNIEFLLYQPAITWQAVVTTYAMGLPFDIIHAASTVLFLWLFTEPALEKLERIKVKYGIF